MIDIALLKCPDNYACEDAQCKSTFRCSSDSECRSGYYCDLDFLLCKRKCTVDSDCGINGKGQPGTCNIATGKCGYGSCSSNSQCESSQSGTCCVDDGSGPKTGEGKCVSPQETPISSYLCVVQSPSQWSVCNENNLGTRMESGGITYVCAKGNETYNWSEVPSSNTAWVLITLGLLLVASRVI